MNDEALYGDIWTPDVIEEAKKLQGPILIVGVSGFIGAKLFFSLRKHREDVYACSRNPQRSWRLLNVKSQTLYNCDITDYDSVKRIVDLIKPMTVFNLAAEFIDRNIIVFNSQVANKVIYFLFEDITQIHHRIIYFYPSVQFRVF